VSDLLAVMIRTTYSSNSKGELRHGVEGVGASVDQLLDELGDLGTSSPLLGKTLDLLRGRDLSGEEEPEESLGEGLRSTRSGRELCLALGDGESSESNTLVRVENGT
jgi:hypothetical protein